VSRKKKSIRRSYCHREVGRECSLTIISPGLEACKDPGPKGEGVFDLTN